MSLLSWDENQPFAKFIWKNTDYTILKLNQEKNWKLNRWTSIWCQSLFLRNPEEMSSWVLKTWPAVGLSRFFHVQMSRRAIQNIHNDLTIPIKSIYLMNFMLDEKILIYKCNIFVSSYFSFLKVQSWYIFPKDAAHPTIWWWFSSWQDSTSNFSLASKILPTLLSDVPYFLWRTFLVPQ